MWGYRLHRSGSGQGKVAGTGECGNEPSGYIECGEFIDQLKSGQFLKKDSVPWSELVMFEESHYTRQNSSELQPSIFRISRNIHNVSQDTGFVLQGCTTWGIPQHRVDDVWVQALWKRTSVGLDQRASVRPSFQMTRPTSLCRIWLTELTCGVVYWSVRMKQPYTCTYLTKRILCL